MTERDGHGIFKLLKYTYVCICYLHSFCINVCIQVHLDKGKHSERIITKFLMVVLTKVEYYGKVEDFHFLLVRAFIL